MSDSRIAQPRRTVSILLSPVLLVLLAGAGCAPVDGPAFGLEDLADQLAADIDRYPGTPSVKVNAEDSAQPLEDELLRLLAERQESSFALVDRSELDSLFEETELGQAGLSPEEERTELGWLATADLTVTLRVSEAAGDAVRVEARLVELETQKLLGVAVARLPPIGELALGLTEPTPADQAKAIRGRLADRSPLDSALDEDQRWSIVLLGCARDIGRTATVFCVVRVENLHDKDDRPFTVFLEQSRLITAEGALHRATSLLHADGTLTQNHNRPRLELAPQAPATLVLGIEGVPEETTTADLEVTYRAGSSTFPAVALEAAPTP